MKNKLLVLLILGLCFSTNSYATGKKRRSNNSDPAPSQAFPVRNLKFTEFGTFPFQSPNGGARVDAGIVVKDLVESQINQSQHFRTVVTVGDGDNQNHLPIITGGITSMVFEVASLGIKFGYNPGGSDAGSGRSVNLTGELDVKIGSMSADFKIYDSVTGETYAATSVDQATAGFDTNFKVNFSQLSIGPEFIAKTPVKNAIQKLAQKAMERLAQQSRVNLLPWESKVLAVDEVRNLVLVDAGQFEGINPGNVFQIYSACNPDVPCFERFIMNVKTMRVLQYSEAAPWNASGDLLHSIQPNDKVYIQYLNGQ